MEYDVKSAVAAIIDRANSLSTKQAGKDQRGVRDGTGPNKGSYRRNVEKKTEGRRMEAGDPCPVADKNASEDFDWDAIDEKDAAYLLGIKAACDVRGISMASITLPEVAAATEKAARDLGL